MRLRHCSALMLIALLIAGSACADDARLQQLWPEHQSRVLDTQTRIDAIHADPGIPAGDADPKAVVEELLGEVHLALDPSTLAGEWKVRSLQGTRYGVFPYPWFKARITPRDGRLFFEKLSGSQRRSGWLLPGADAATDWIFLGGASVNEDAQVGYSKADGAPAPRDSDTVARVWGIAEGRVLMLLDVSADSYEVYQLKR